MSATVVVDNGSFECRVGLAADTQPKYCFAPAVLRGKGASTQKEAVLMPEGVLQADIARGVARTAWEGSVLTNVEVQEKVLDFAFGALGVGDALSTTSVALTEPVCAPNFSRAWMSELLFETYQVRSLCYAVDALCSLSFNQAQGSSLPPYALLVSIGHRTTHVIPVVDAAVCMGHCIRVPLGGLQVSDYLAQLLSLKYPPIKLLLQNNAHVWARQFCRVATSYETEVERFRSLAVPPCASIPVPGAPKIDPKEVEEQNRRRQQQRQAQAERLRDMQRKRKEQKLGQLELELAQLKELKAAKKSVDAKQYKGMLSAKGLSSAVELGKAITQTEHKLMKAQGIEPPPQAAPSQRFDLVDVPDEDLTDAQKREKKKQVMLKQMAEGRERVRRQKEEQRKREEEAKERDERLRVEHPQAWLNKLRTQYSAVLRRMNESKQDDNRMGTGRVAGGKRKRKLMLSMLDDGDDSFGANDDDWDVYLAESSEEQAEADQEEKSHLEALLTEHDPNFTPPTLGLAQQPQEPQIVREVVFGSELIRAPELLFRPHLMGIEVAGISEVAELVLNRFPAATRQHLAQNVFVCGGGGSIAGVVDRLHKDLQAVVPCNVDVRVTAASDCELDGWRGLARHAAHGKRGSKSGWMTKAQYEEQGPDFLAEHSLSNPFTPTPQGKGK